MAIIRSAAPASAVEASKTVGRAPVLQGPVITRSYGIRARFTPAEHHYTHEPVNGCEHGVGDAAWCGICKHGPGDDEFPGKGFPRKHDVPGPLKAAQLPRGGRGDARIYLPTGSRESMRARKGYSA